MFSFSAHFVRPFFQAEGVMRQQFSDSDYDFERYDGWGHDRGRTWRKGERLEAEGYKGFKSTFGDAAFTLNHRFYLHFGRRNEVRNLHTSNLRFEV